MKTWLTMLTCLGVLTGCEMMPGGGGAGETTKGGDGTTMSESTGGTPGSDGGTAGSDGSTASDGESPTTPTGWQYFPGAIPCSDKGVMWWDDDNHGFWGCGRRGQPGFWTTTDGGLHWKQQKKFEGVLVQGITRAPNGTLYVGGAFGAAPVASVDESSPDKMDYTELYQRGNNAYTSVAQAESVAVLEDGQMLIESLTGTTAAYHPGESAAGQQWFEKYCTGESKSDYNPVGDTGWCELDGVGEENLDDIDAPNYQITALLAAQGRFYAAGYQLSTPATVRLPSLLDGGTYHMASVPLQKSSESGSMVALHVWPDGSLIAVGSDNSGYLPLVYRCGAALDCYDPTAWEDIEMDEHVDFADDLNVRDGRGLAVRGETVVVVANQVPNANGGYVFISRDRGTTWQAPIDALAALDDKGKVPMLYGAHVFENGDILLLGDKNFVFRAN